MIHLRREIRAIEQTRDIRCPDCGRRWPKEQAEAAYAHVMARCDRGKA